MKALRSQTRIGVLVPVGNTSHEAEFERLRPEDVRFYFRHFVYPHQNSRSYCESFADQLEGPLNELRDWGVAAAILVGCTTATMECADPTSEARIASVARVPLITAARASKQAASALSVRRARRRHPIRLGRQ